MKTRKPRRARSGPGQLELEDWLNRAPHLGNKRYTLKLQIRVNLHAGDWIDLAQASAITGRPIERILGGSFQSPNGWREMVNEINGSVTR